MSKKTKVWLLIAGCLVAAGLLLFAAVLAANDWDLTKLSTEEYETNTHIPTESFSKIHIYTEEADVLSSHRKTIPVKWSATKAKTASIPLML